jgi:hypothetical protein
MRERSIVRVPVLAFVLLGGAACLGYDAGIELAIELRVAPPTRAVPMGEGFATLDEASLRVASIEVVPCEVAWSWVVPSWVVPARAHAQTTIVDGDAVVVDALHMSGMVAGPVLRPPPGSVCALRVHFEPEGDQASFALAGEAEGARFVRRIEEPFDVDLPFARRFEAPEDGGGVELSVDPACWLRDGVPSEDALVERLAGCLTAR